MRALNVGFSASVARMSAATSGGWSIPAYRCAHAGYSLDGKISDLIIIAAPRTLGELRKSYHKSCPKFSAARFRKTLRVMRCTISRKQSPRHNALSASRKQRNPATEAGFRLA
jgi:hypothetical protein